MRRVLCLLSVLAVASACRRPPLASEIRPAPQFELQSLRGGTLSLASLHGKVVVLDFWATWCGPCLAEIPEYDEFWKRNQPRGVEVVGVVVDSGDPQEIADFVRENRIAYRQVLGNDQIEEAYGVTQGLPTTFVIDKEGKIRLKILGSPPAKFNNLQRTVDAALSTS